MKAIVLRQFGGPEVLRLEEGPAPRPAPAEILIKVRSVSVNRTLDCTVRAGKYPVEIKLPHVLGVDPAGEVVEVGAGVGRFKPGDRVATISIVRCLKCKQCLKGSEANCLASQHIGLHRWGGYAEYVAVPERNAFRVPDNLSFAEGTVITRHFPMAFNLLTNKTRVEPGEWVLVMGAAGALGSCCVQVAKMYGAKVIAAAGADDRVALAMAYGADFGVNYRKQDLAKEVMKLTDNDGVDVVCENIADPALWTGAFNSLAIGGRLVTAGAHGGGTVELDVKRLYLRRQSIHGAAGTNPPDVEKALDAARAGKIRAMNFQIMPLSAAAEAHRIVEENQIAGKIILDPTMD
ncbi:MAG TPA: zinc-binding dehydrogenase [Candidatus Binatia bacterium]|nr:zinc-binding dehydrogenase [Candidatus Binatia bacterium]